MRKSDRPANGFLDHLQSYPEPRSRIVSIGIALPERVVTNEDVVESIEAEPAIKRRLATLIYRSTLIKTRRYAEPGTPPSSLAAQAALDALARADLGTGDIDTLIFAGTDVDMLEPATANILQKKLRLPMVNSFDVSNACNSFLQAMNVANSLITSGAARRVLIATGEVGSYWASRRIESLSEFAVKIGGLTLGDAGAAVVMERGADASGLLEINLLNIGEHWELCRGPHLLDWRQREGGLIHGWFYLDMPGLAKVARRLSIEYFTGYQHYRRQAFGERHFQDSLAQVVPHQISRRFIEDIVKAVHSDMRLVCVTADRFGNTASAALPLALRTLLDEGTLAHGSGQEVLLYGAASGFGLGHIRLRL